MTVADPRSPLLDAHDPYRVTEALHGLADGLLGTVGAELQSALDGSDSATRAYVRDYRRLTGCVLAEAQRTRPDLLSGSSAAPSSGVSVIYGSKRAVAVMAIIEHASADAPFTPWAARFELADAVGLDLANRVRLLLGAAPLIMPDLGAVLKPAALDDVAVRRFLRRVRHYLNHPEDEEPLTRLLDAFGLSKTELAGLFGVSRQAIDGWRENGVPAERQEKLVTLLDIADLLDRKLKAGRLPGVARRPAEAYGGLAMLELITADRHRELLESVRASFDWSQAG